MFKKGNQKEGGVLADRMKAIASRPALAEESYVDLSAKKDHRAPREPTYKQATVMLAAGERFGVVVKNLSHTGARIEFFKNVTLTDRLILAEPTMRIRKWAQVVWQKEGAAGLRFLGDAN